MVALPDEKSGMDNAMSTFDKFGEEVLFVDADIRGKERRIMLLQELMYDDHDLVDYQKLVSRMHKLPATLMFYAVLKYNAAKKFSEAKENFDIWYAGTAKSVQAAMTTEIDEQKDSAGKKIAASLKKAPTLDQIRGQVMTRYGKDWKEKKAAVDREEERLAVLTALIDGLRESIRLLGSESRLLETLVNRGIEVVTSNPNSRFNEHLKKT